MLGWVIERDQGSLFRLAGERRHHRENIYNNSLGKHRDKKATCTCGPNTFAYHGPTGCLSAYTYQTKFTRNLELWHRNHIYSKYFLSPDIVPEPAGCFQKRCKAVGVPSMCSSVVSPLCVAPMVLGELLSVALKPVVQVRLNTPFSVSPGSTFPGPEGQCQEHQSSIIPKPQRP